MFEPNIKIVTEEEKEESRRQQGLLDVKQNKKFHCPEKVAAGFKHFFHGRGHIGKIGVEKDGRHYIQIFRLNLEIKSLLASLYSDKAFHEFLNNCYDSACEIYKKRLEATKAAREADLNNSKKCQNETEKLRKEQTCRSADLLLLEQQKIKKPTPPFDKDNYRTYAGLPPEDAGRSKDILMPQKTIFLKKKDGYEKQIQQFTTESDAFQKEVNALKIKLEAASDEKQYKNIRLTYDFNELQVKKLQKKIEEAEQRKADIETELKGLDKQIDILNCVLDSHQLTKDAENWQNRKERAVERIRKVIEDRESFNMMRQNLNVKWQKLIADPEPKEKRVSIFSQDKPTKPEKIADELCLKADARNYFI
jgi:predicted  nucleic acid-binding Zn-ribbon protein